MNEFIDMNYFIVKGEHSAHLVLLWFFSTTHPFQTFYVLRGWVPSIILVSPQLCTYITVSISLSVLLHYLVGFLSFPHTSMSVLLCRAIRLSRYTLFGVQIDFSRRQYHSQIFSIWSKSVQLSTSYSSYIDRL